MQELIFTLKSAIDDFRHTSTKFYLIFIDFADAFGSVNHTFMFETLCVFNIPDIYNCLIEDLCKYSSFRVICGFELTEHFFITRCTKTGDPFSAFMFILVIDRICKPMVVTAMVSLNLENEQRLNRLPAFADDIAMVAYNVSVINEMVRSSEPIMECTGLEVTPIKCAVYIMPVDQEIIGILEKKTKYQIYVFRETNFLSTPDQLHVNILEHP